MTPVPRPRRPSPIAAMRVEPSIPSRTQPSLPPTLDPGFAHAGSSQPDPLAEGRATVPSPVPSIPPRTSAMPPPAPTSTHARERVRTPAIDERVTRPVIVRPPPEARRTSSTPSHGSIPIALTVRARRAHCQRCGDPLDRGILRTLRGQLRGVALGVAVGVAVGALLGAGLGRAPRGVASSTVPATASR